MTFENVMKQVKEREDGIIKKFTFLPDGKLLSVTIVYPGWENEETLNH